MRVDAPGLVLLQACCSLWLSLHSAVHEEGALRLWSGVKPAVLRHISENHGRLERMAQVYSSQLCAIEM